MMNVGTARCAIAAALLVSPLPLPGQPGRRWEPAGPIILVPALPIPISVPCCRCIGATSRKISIATGLNAWSVTGPGVPAGAYAQTMTANFDPLWTMGVTQGQWVHPLSSNGGNQPAGTFNYSILIEVPHCTIPMQVSLSGRAAADERLTGYLDATPFVSTPTVAIASLPAIPAGAVGWGFRTERIASFANVPLTPGTHSLRFEVPNIASFFGNPTPHGLVVSADLNIACSDRLIPVQPGEGRGLAAPRAPG